MDTRVQDVLDAARRLSPREQLDLIRSISESLQAQYDDPQEQLNRTMEDSIPGWVKRTRPATNFEDYAADFWPEDESTDELADYVRQQRKVDQTSDQ